MYILSPTETINRDLDGQLLVAARYPGGDASFFFGTRSALATLAPSVRNGLFFGKVFEPSFPNTDFGLYQKLKSNGFVVLHLDDEGAVFGGQEENWRRTLLRRLDPRRIDETDLICTWGDWQREFYSQVAPSIAQNMLTTGHPRFDLLRPRYRAYHSGVVSQLRTAYGDFVLFNTTLGLANHGLGLAHIFSNRYGYHPENPASSEKMLDNWAHRSRTLIALVQLVHRMARELPHLSIVVRPHPSEDHSYYRTVFRGLKNVHVIYDSSVTPWLLASRLVIHDGSTTGIEAALCGVEVACYTPLQNPSGDVYLPNLFGKRCTSDDELIDLARNILDRPGITASSPAAITDARRLLLNVDGETCDLLLDTLAEGRRRLIGAPSYDERTHRVWQTGAAILAEMKGRIRPLSHWRQLNFRYSRVKFGGFHQAKVPEKIAAFEKVTGRRIVHRIISDQLLLVQPQG